LKSKAAEWLTVFAGIVLVIIISYQLVSPKARECHASGGEYFVVDGCMHMSEAGAE